MYECKDVWVLHSDLQRAIIGLYSSDEIKYFIYIDSLSVQSFRAAGGVHILVVAVHVHGAEEGMSSLPLNW